MENLKKDQGSCVDKSTRERSNRGLLHIAKTETCSSKYVFARLSRSDTEFVCLDKMCILYYQDKEVSCLTNVFDSTSRKLPITLHEYEYYWSSNFIQITNILYKTLIDY